VRPWLTPLGALQLARRRTESELMVAKPCYNAIWRAFISSARIGLKSLLQSSIPGLLNKYFQIFSHALRAPKKRADRRRGDASTGAGKAVFFVG
jgi:hypothetical protein